MRKLLEGFSPELALRARGHREPRWARRDPWSERFRKISVGAETLYKYELANNDLRKVWNPDNEHVFDNTTGGRQESGSRALVPDVEMYVQGAYNTPRRTRDDC